MTTLARTRRVLTSAADSAWAAGVLASGAIVAQGFANFYAITTRSDAATVRAVNLMKGRPPGQVGSITGPPAVLRDAWDFGRLPAGLSRRRVLNLMDAFFALGPLGFRGPASAAVPDHLSLVEAGLRTAQVIAPGYACPSNDFLRRAVHACDDDLLYITSANRSHHQTGAEDSPAHWRADGLLAEFCDERGFVVLEHINEAAARARYPAYLPMSATVLGFHTVHWRSDDPRPHLVLERHGSLHAEAVRAVLDELGFGLVIGPKAGTRLLLRDYSQRLSDRLV